MGRVSYTRVAGVLYLQKLYFILAFVRLKDYDTYIKDLTFASIKELYMGQTVVLEEREDEFDPDTGEILKSSRKTRQVRKTKMEPTDQFVKVSKYLNVIFAYRNIPLTLVPISLLFAQRMEYKTNRLTLLKDDKEEIAAMLQMSLKRVESLIMSCKRYDIIRPVARGKYEVNGYLFSTGDYIETRKLQAHFDFDSDTYIAEAEQKNLITGKVVRKAVRNKDIPGQLHLNLETGEVEEGGTE